MNNTDDKEDDKEDDNFEIPLVLQLTLLTRKTKWEH